MYSLGTRLGYAWGHFQEYASSPGQNEKTTGQGDVGGEVRWEGDAHDAHTRIAAGGHIGGARRARLCRPAPSLRVVAGRPVLPQAAVLVIFVQTRIAASSRIGLVDGISPGRRSAKSPRPHC